MTAANYSEYQQLVLKNVRVYILGDGQTVIDESQLIAMIVGGSFLCLGLGATAVISIYCWCKYKKQVSNSLAAEPAVILSTSDRPGDEDKVTATELDNLNSNN